MSKSWGVLVLRTCPQKSTFTPFRRRRIYSDAIILFDIYCSLTVTYEYIFKYMKRKVLKNQNILLVNKIHGGRKKAPPFCGYVRQEDGCWVDPSAKNLNT